MQTKAFFYRTAKAAGCRNAKRVARKAFAKQYAKRLPHGLIERYADALRRADRTALGMVR